MEKNWLIRTKSNHILGPISKSKLTELLQSGSLKPEDEICSGNGFWMFIREKELLEKYVLADEPQPFNPVSEANSVLTSPVEMNFSEFRSAEELSLDNHIEEDTFDFEETEKTSGASEISLPDSSELSYPELEETMPPDMDLEFTEVSELNPTVDQEVAPQKKKVIRKKPLNDLASNEKIKKSWLNDKVLFSMAIFLLIVAIMAFYFRKRIIEKFLDSSVQVEFIESVQAQPFLSSSQKKSLNSQS